MVSWIFLSFSSSDPDQESISFALRAAALKYSVSFHEKKCLERGVGSFAAGDAGVAARGVEDGHLGRGKAALPEGVNASALGGRAGGGLELVGEGTRESHHFPESCRLWSFDAASAHFGVEETGDGEELVADDFGVEPGAGAAGEEAVFGVSFEINRAAGGGLLVSFGEDERLHEGFYVPTGFHELEGEVVEEFWMAGPHALGSEVFGGLHDSGAEELLPETIDRNAGGKGILLIDEPVGEIHTGRNFPRGFEWRKEGGGVAVYLFANRCVVTPNGGCGRG